MPARKPRIEYYWAPTPHEEGGHSWFVNWRLIGANGEIMCQSTQGYRDKPDARRAVDAVVRVFAEADGRDQLREIGPGKRPS